MARKKAKRRNKNLFANKIFTVLVVLIAAFNTTNIYASSDVLYNDSLSYSFDYVSPDFDSDNGVVSPSYYLAEVDLSQSQKEKLSKFTYDDWIEFLTSLNTDFSANIILYSYYEKDAILLIEVDKKGWRKHGKSDDLKFWNEFLKKNKLPVWQL